MIEWVEELRAGFTEEFGTGPKIVTLATVDAIGRPRARTVVCRHVDDGGMVVIASDARSEKNMSIRRRGAVELCAWLPTLRRQFRLCCLATVAGEAEAEAAVQAERPAEPVRACVPMLEQLNRQNLREQIWAEMSEAARALFFWPQPGAPLVADAAAFPQAVRTGLPPANFEMVVLFPADVDLLDLAHHPHRRRLWQYRDGHWRAERVNP